VGSVLRVVSVTLLTVFVLRTLTLLEIRKNNSQLTVKHNIEKRLMDNIAEIIKYYSESHNIDFKLFQYPIDKHEKKMKF
jgi:hypothetical protein